MPLTNLAAKAAKPREKPIKRIPSKPSASSKAASVHTFKTVAHKWRALQSKALSADTPDMLHTRLDSYLVPRVGHRPIGAVTAQELLGICVGLRLGAGTRPPIGYAPWRVGYSDMRSPDGAMINHRPTESCDLASSPPSVRR